MDDIETIAGIAADYNVGCHVDNCLGGFVNWFVEYSLEDVLPFDFRTRGVTTISADTHKFGYGPKGMSVWMMRPKRLFEYFMFVSVDHSGVPFTMNHFGTHRSGAIVAGTWSAMIRTGLKGYVNAVRRIMQMTNNFRDRIQKDDELVLYGQNNSYWMTWFNTVGINPLSVSCKIKEDSEWNLIEVMLPPLIHFLAMESNSDQLNSKIKVEDLFKNIKNAVNKVKRNVDVKSSMYQAFYGTVIGIKDPSIVELLIAYFIYPKSLFYIKKYSNLCICLNNFSMIIRNIKYNVLNKSWLA